jgi:methylthioribulose-1-phosphate dehydratase
MAEKASHTKPNEELAAIGRELYRRGWLVGQGGNLSVLMARKPMRLWIINASSSRDALDDTNYLEIDDDAEILQGFGRPSDESLLHLAVYRHRPRARCILFSRTVAGTVLSDVYFTDGAVTIKGYEAVKGLSSRVSETLSETVPIAENSSDAVAMAHVFENILMENPTSCGILIRRHGFYTWGGTVGEAMQNIEIFEYLFQVLEQTRQRK